MRAHVIENGIVVNTIDVDSLDFLPNLVDGENSGAIGDLYINGEFVKPSRPAQEVYDEVTKLTQERLDDFAKTRNYSGILSLCSYATGSNLKFKQEGEYGVLIREQTWAKLYEILAEIEAGTRPVPSGYSEIAHELPTLEWPE
jgi:hypothetical protein